MFDLPNSDVENERMLLTPAGNWYGRRATAGPEWTQEFLQSAIAAGSIVETGTPDRSTPAAWGRVLTVIAFAVAVIACGTYPLWGK